MGTRADEVYAAALELDGVERANIARRLLATLRDDDPTSQADVDAAWSAEIDLRVDAVLNGSVALEDFTTTRAKARTVLDEVRG